MGLFGKKDDRDALIAKGIADAEAAAVGGDKGEKEFKTGNEKVDIELTKIYAQLDSFNEIRKANSERFQRLSEQLGEVRGMIVDTNKAMSKIEVAATKAVDLVESVHPEKLMIEVRKQDGKVEALRANIESSEAIVKDLMGELKKMREQMNFYKGLEQVAQLNEEVKGELANIKKMEAVIERHADKVESIFVEVQKKFAAFDKFDSIVNDVQGAMKKIESDFDKMRIKLETKEDKKEFVALLDKFNNFETHTTNLLKLLDERSKMLKESLEKDFKRLKDKLERRLKTGPVNLDEPDAPAKGVKAGKPVVMPAQGGGEVGADAANAGADVAGGDVKKPGGFAGLFKRKIVAQPLDAAAPKAEEKAAAPAKEEEEKFI
jgi:DNA repair exonuclease SbcCD ATPase subunit